EASCPSLPTRHQQVEQDRAPDVLPHHEELAWSTAQELPNIGNLISNTKTQKGLIVRAALDPTEYETGIPVTKDQLSRLHLKRHKFHGDWNYTITPRR